LQKAAANDIRVIAEALGRFAAANNHYARPTPESAFVPVESLMRDLVPDHVAVIPASDPWGGTYWYWTNGEHFVVGSEGPDGVGALWRNAINQDPRGPSRALENLCSSPGKGAVLLIDGRFCELPKDVTHGPSTGSLTEDDRGRLTVDDLRICLFR